MRRLNMMVTNIPLSSLAQDLQESAVFVILKVKSFVVADVNLS